VEADNERLNSELEEARSQLAEARGPQHQLYAKIKELEERNRLLCIKSREERQKLEEKIAALEYRDISQSRRLAEKQDRLDELESAAELQQQPAPAIDLSDKAGEVASYLKTLLCDEKLLSSTLTKVKRNKPVALPRDVISEVERILGGSK